MSLQEKFQITVLAREEKDEPWVTAQSQQTHEGNPKPDHGQRFNKLPTTAIEDDRTHHMPLSLAGQTDVTDCLTPKALLKGFIRPDMKGTDDQYTGEHIDLFYGDSGGFVERNNMLDRI